MTFNTYNIPVCLSSTISKKGSRELIFYIMPFEKQPLILKDYYLSEHGQEIGCYESIQFIINGKELDDDEIDSFEGYSKIDIQYKSIQDFMNKNYIKVVLHNPVYPIFNDPKLYIHKTVETDIDIIFN